MSGLLSRFSKVLVSFAIGTACFGFQARAAQLPPNLSSNLRRLITIAQSSPNTVNLNTVRLALNPATKRYELVPSKKSNPITDQQNRILVRIVLDGTVPSAAVEKAVTALGANVTDTSPFGQDQIAAYVPLQNAASLAQIAGVKSVHLSRPPRRNVGQVTAQSVVALHADEVQADGYKGKGITVGLMSDSFNTSGNLDNAAHDVSTGDLPNTTAIHGGEGLKALIEDSPNGTDEGRAMAQILHDMAPKADLCFATANDSSLHMARNILRLASEKGPCNADIIVDDVTYSDEPFFSDGVIAQAVNYVSTFHKQNGNRVTYFSSAGNVQDQGYDSHFNKVTLKVASQQPSNPVDFSTIPKSIDIGGGLHNFGSAQSIITAQHMMLAGPVTIILQWDDPFHINGITADYNLLLFNQNGQFVDASDLNAGNDAFASDEPVQELDFDADPNGTDYYLVIARSSRGAHLSTHLKYLFFDGIGVAAFFNDSTSMVLGHHGAAHNIAVGAYAVNRPPFLANPPYQPELEFYSSPGPFWNYFDSFGNRLPQPEIRSKPEISCADGLFTTFFGEFDLPTDVFPRFYGTSAAAPCAAGIAALMLDKARSNQNHVTVGPDDITAMLEYSVPSHDIDPLFIRGASSFANNGTIVVQAHGDNNNIGDPSNFRVESKGTGTWQLTRLRIDLPPSVGLNFFQFDNFPFVVGNTSPGVTVSLLNLTPPPGGGFVQANSIHLGFTGFKSGDFAEFDVDRLDTALGMFIDDSADRLQNATYAATLTSPLGQQKTVRGSLTNRRAFSQWNRFDGFGLVDAASAVAFVP